MRVNDDKMNSIFDGNSMTNGLAQHTSSGGISYSPDLEMLIDYALADGELTEKEKQVLFKKAQSLGIDLGEFEMVLEARLFEKKSIKKTTNPIGELLKCPYCGEPISAGDSVCPSCGRAFSGIKATESSKRLAELLSEFNKQNPVPQQPSDNKGDVNIHEYQRYANAYVARNQKKMEIITSFPVPNNRADLLDLLTATKPLSDIKASKKGLIGYNTYQPREELGYGYWVLFSNCVNKAKVSFPNDSAFKAFIDYYDEQTKSKKGFFAKLFGR